MVIREVLPPTGKTSLGSKRSHVITRSRGRLKAADDKRRCKQAPHCDGDMRIPKALQPTEKTPLGSKRGHITTRSSVRPLKVAKKKRRRQQSPECDDDLVIQELQEAIEKIPLGSKRGQASARCNGHPLKAADQKRSRQQGPLRNGPTSSLNRNHEEHEVIQAVQSVPEAEVYRMERKPRGMCIIINNEQTGGNSNQKEAANNDAHNMKSLFTELGFNVTEKINLTAGGILLELVIASDTEELENADCLVVVLISSGNKDVIRGTDGEELYLRRQVYPLFNEVNCPDLQGKPKLFFVQTFENSHADGRTMDGPHSTAPEAGLEYYPSRWSDMYCAHGTIPSNVTGTWFLSAINSVFRQRPLMGDFNELMTRVADEMTQRSVTRPQKLNINPNELKKKLYFNPGF